MQNCTHHGLFDFGVDSHAEDIWSRAEFVVVIIWAVVIIRWDVIIDNGIGRKRHRRGQQMSAGGTVRAVLMNVVLVVNSQNFLAS